MKNHLFKIICAVLCAVALAGCMAGCGKNDNGEGSANAPEPQGITVGGEYIVSDENRFVMRGEDFVACYYCEGNEITGCVAYADMGDEETAKESILVYKKLLTDVVDITNVDNYLVVTFGPGKYSYWDREKLETICAEQKIRY